MIALDDAHFGTTMVNTGHWHTTHYWTHVQVQECTELSEVSASVVEVRESYLEFPTKRYMVTRSDPVAKS